MGKCKTWTLDCGLDSWTGLWTDIWTDRARFDDDRFQPKRTLAVCDSRKLSRIGGESFAGDC